MKDSENILNEEQQKEPDKLTPSIQPDWELNPDNYLRDALGSFILKVDGTPRLKAGKKPGSPHNFHSETKARMDHRRKVNEAKISIKKAERELEEKRAKLGKRRESLQRKVDVAKKLDATLGKLSYSTVLEADKVSEMAKSLADKVRDEDYNVAFRPNPGPQTEFLAAPETDVLYGGAAGGEPKSWFPASFPSNGSK
jgi:hypothetical protein